MGGVVSGEKQKLESDRFMMKKGETRKHVDTHTLYVYIYIYIFKGLKL